MFGAIYFGEVAFASVPFVTTVTTTSDADAFPKRRGAGRKKVHPLPYWVGVTLQVEGPPMPMLDMGLRWTPAADTVAPKARAIFSPRPVLAPPIRPSWVRMPRPVVGILLTVTGPDLPWMEMAVQYHDIDGEMAGSLLLAILEASEW